MIRVSNIKKTYGSKKVLDDISFTIKDSESVAIIGENGSGKSTLAEIIVKSLEPDLGTVTYCDENDAKITPKIGFQYQSNSWPQEIRVSDLITFYTKCSNFDKTQLNHFLEIFEIKTFFNADIKSLSGGEKQRINFLLAIINNPDFLVLDELFSGLDLRMQFKLIKYIKSNFLKENKSLMVISHIPEEIKQLCNRAIFIKNGKIFKDIEINEQTNLREKMVSFFEKGDF